MGRQLWLADVLRGAGLSVVEEPGWRTRSAAEDPDASGFHPVGLIIHETRGSATSTDAAELGVLINGRVGLSGPIAQLYLSRSGVWHTVAAGRCHHVKTGWGGPFTGMGNANLLGIEAQHSQAEDWALKPVQYASYVAGVAAILAHTGWPAPVGHKEHQPGDKPDPEFSMPAFRPAVAAKMQEVDMEQDETLTYPTGNPRRNVGQVLADLSNLRDWLYAPPSAAGVNPPPAGSRAQLLVTPASAEPAPVDVAALAAALAPAMQEAAEAAVRRVLGAVDGATPPA